ncbi:hypothetical protein I5F68_32315 [Pseudomonas aeruginosa]|nr:hypothetical protein [Pseudomonas aeruginosa]
MDWVFGDFQSLKPNPDEHRIQPIGASQLGSQLSLMSEEASLSEPIRFREKMPVMTSRAVIRAKLRAARVAMGILRKDMMADSRGQEEGRG